jgi:hypothetical protein
MTTIAIQYAPNAHHGSRAKTLAVEKFNLAEETVAAQRAAAVCVEPNDG